MYSLLTQIGDNRGNLGRTGRGQQGRQSGWRSCQLPQTAVLEQYRCVIISLHSNLAKQPYANTSIVLGHLEGRKAETKWHDLVHCCAMVPVLRFRCEGLVAHGKQSTYIFHTMSAYSMCWKGLSSKHRLLVFNMFNKKGLYTFSELNLNSIGFFFHC